LILDTSGIRELSVAAAEVDPGDTLTCVATTKPRRPTRAAVIAVVLMMTATVDLMLLPSPTARAVDATAIRVASSKLIRDSHYGWPVAVLSLYEDALCPYCRKFEDTFGATVDKLIETGAVAVDYYMVAILDRPERDYSSRAGAAAYCVADESIDAFRRFHAALYTQQPPETAASFPDNGALIDTARQAGAGEAAVDCINNSTYTEMVAGMAEATNVAHTPTVRINGQDYELSTPEALVAKIKEIVGPVPGMDAQPTGSTQPG
jgi:protein-disulfide isomerase